MDFVIKPTQKCNFACTFCSSTKIAKTNVQEINVDNIIKFLKRFPQTKTIIVNGGEPLLMSPQYYQTILDYITDNNLNCCLGFTSNLWDFYNNPEKWKSILSHKNVETTTSFQLNDNSRKLGNGQIFTQEMFEKIYNLYKKEIGKELSFISVVCDTNEDKAIQTVEYAKSIGIVCKLNPMVKSGRSNEIYPLWKMIKIYLKIIDMGLENYEKNCRNLKNFYIGKSYCPFSYNHKCLSNIRCLSPDNSYNCCPSLNDDNYDDNMKYKLDYDFEMNGNDFNVDEFLSKHSELKYIRDDCLTCECFSFCNSCVKTVKDYKIQSQEFLNNHCKEMKLLIKKIKDL